MMFILYKVHHGWLFVLCLLAPISILFGSFADRRGLARTWRIAKMFFKDAGEMGRIFKTHHITDVQDGKVRVLKGLLCFIEASGPDPFRWWHVIQAIEVPFKTCEAAAGEICQLFIRAG